MKNFLLFLVSIALIGCSSLNGYKEKIHPLDQAFIAKYFNGEEFIASEKVDRISIHYPWSDFHNINSRSFRAVWEGEIDGGDEGKNVTMSFYDSHASRSVYLDGKKITGWSNSNKHTSEFVEPGIHKLRLEFANGWHTTNFTASFDNYPTVEKNELKNIFKDTVDPLAKVAYIGAYESGDIYNRVTISVPKLKHPIIIFLSSNNGINWIIDNPHKTNVSHVVIRHRGGTSITNNQENTKTFYLNRFRGSYKNYSATASEIRDITGLAVSYTYGEYSLTNVTIPEIL
ncbi:hypothetical protein KO528_07735 [Saccharophagus degradans]|uniref:hypothetical protein n=1 Tax=Saccharophagus degradans TaxID=86304 RepID=UPI001C09331D|nr:hypothetical protein [Saccharophagus degradans]MBU2985238.1 hypothetical protein [Saccharophagus degradans]